MATPMRLHNATEPIDQCDSPAQGPDPQIRLLLGQAQFGPRYAVFAYMALYAVLLLLILSSTAQFVYDEPEYIFYTKLLARYGLSEKFLLSLTGSAGPLFGIVHFILQPLTHLRPLGARLVSFTCFLSMVAIIFLTLRRINYGHALMLSAAAITLPMSWAIAGLALTEAPAMLFVSLSLLLLVIARPERVLWARELRLVAFLASALCLGIASTGRQPFLLLSIVPFCAAVIRRENIRPSLAYMGLAWLPILPAVLVWRSILPPVDQQFVTSNFPLSPAHASLSLGYAALMVVILAPTFLLPGVRIFSICLVPVLVLNFIFRAVTFPVMMTLVSSFLPEPFLSWYCTACGSILICSGLSLLAVLIRSAWERRSDYVTLIASLAFLLVIVSPLFITYQYSSRYTAVALPFLLVAIRDWYKPSVATFAVGLLGSLAGMISLWEYYRVFRDFVEPIL